MVISNQEIINRIKQLTGNDAFVYDKKSEKWLSYNEVWMTAVSLARIPAIRDHSSIIAITENGIHLFSLYFACMISNTTIIPLDPHKAEKELDDIIGENPDTPVLKDDDALWENNDLLNEPNAESLSELISQIDLEKVYMITYTSGSTGHAKGVIHSLRNLFLAAAAFGEATGLNGDYTMCHVMPMTYMAGILNTIIMPFYRGCKIVLLPRFDVISAVSFWKNVEKYDITAFWLSPTMLNVLMTIDRKAKIKEYLDNRKTLFFIGTAPLFENVRNNFEGRYGVKLLQSYGLSETLFISTERPETENDSKSVGSVLDDVVLTFLKDGEIGIRVPWMFYGYSNENTDDYFWENNYMSGDLGEVKNNRLYITGRKKDLIVKGGMNISPSQIEKCIAQTGLVKECAVSGVVIKDEENIVCWYVRGNGAGNPEKEINRGIEEKLGRHCRIDYFFEVDEIPKNLNGKTDKKKLAEDTRNDLKV